MEDIYVEKEVMVKHADGWGYSIQEVDDNGVQEYKIAYMDVEDDKFVKKEFFRISSMLAKTFFEEALELVNQKEK